MKLNNKFIVLMTLLILGISGDAFANSQKISVARAFYELARQNNTAKIESLLNRGYSLESPDETGNTPVCLAVIKQNRQAYNTLLSYGAKQNPSCLSRIPEKTYVRFFKTAPAKTMETISYTPDKPYLIGTAAIAAGAVAAAYIFRGDTDSKKDDGSEGEEGTSPAPGPNNCPEHSTYNDRTKKCVCNAGYGNYGDNKKCYVTIVNCADQNKETCVRCADNYLLKNNACYAKINHCSVQDGPYCTTCESGFGIHNSDKTACYKDVANCKQQVGAFCEECNAGFGTHNGDKMYCYPNIANCLDQVQDACRQCVDGYDTFGDPYTCYKNNPCTYPNTIPINHGAECVCDEAKGWSGSPENCELTDEGEFNEGDEKQEQWNNYNELYCNSHGKYETTSKLCLCYTGYMGKNCTECREEYIMFSGICYPRLSCSANMIQKNDKCVCNEDAGYISYTDPTGVSSCMKQVACPLHYEQVAPGPNLEDACACRENFDEACENCLPGFSYDQSSDKCIRTSFLCDEAYGKWTGEDCNVCPSEYKISADGLYCGPECADNRAPYDPTTNPDCSVCAEGYEYSGIDNTCITTKCSEGQEGYVVVTDEYGHKTCTCDTENGYGMSTLGVCKKKDPDLIGIKDSNINNTTTTVENDSIFRDVYGMKSIASTDEEGNITYFDNVYNALSSSGASQTAAINITNSNVGGNRVYGIYSQSNIYNAAAVNTGAANTGATGKITITDKNSASNIYGMYNSDAYDAYNAFTYAVSGSPTENRANALISITKDEDGSGKIVGITGGKNIYNAYANTNSGIGASVWAEGTIDIKHEGAGTAIGIEGTNNRYTVTNALAYMDSAVSNALSKGTITVSGKGEVYGIKSNGSVVNSKTQFDKSYKIIPEFGANGRINVSTTSDKDTVYGIYSSGDLWQKTSVYNAMGYNSTGDIIVTSKNGSGAYGIYSGQQTYVLTDEEGNAIKDENGKSTLIYNNTYNAFRSSAKYGDKLALGNIELNISGLSSESQRVVGLFAKGNAFNAFANSGSDVNVSTTGNITINDKSTTTNMQIRGLESAGATIANAYSIGTNLNTATKVEGNINVNIAAIKSGLTEASGIYSGTANPQGTKIYNAALINDTNTSIGNINVDATARAPSKMYGIYAASYDTGEGTENAQPKTIYNAYYENSTDVSAGKVVGNISVTAPYESRAVDGGYYGIYIKEGTAYNAYSTNSNADVSGTINVMAAGGAGGGEVVGMYGESATLNNTGKSLINVRSTGKAIAYGMKGIKSHITNGATIKVQSDKADAYGIYVDKGSATNTESGKIEVQGSGNNVGIYAISDGTQAGAAVVINNGNIYVSGGENIGIKGVGETTTVTNNGMIILDDTSNYCNGESCNNGTAIVLEQGATYENKGTTATSGSFDFDAMGGNVVLASGGKFEAKDKISGKLNVSANVVTDSFKNAEVLEGALKASDVAGVDLNSGSYLYNARKKEAENGTYDVVMDMKSFDDVTDADKAKYLAKNYTAEKNAALFNTLKSASSASEYQQREADMFGTAVLPNMTAENLKVQRSLDRAMMSELFNEGADVRRMVGADSLYLGRDDHGTLSGYDINAQSMYALYDKKMDNRYRLGLGMSITHTDTDYNNDSTRKGFIIQGYVPLTYTNMNGLTAVSMARIGYMDGDYKRRGYGKTFEADTNAITYGISNEVRYKVNLGFADLTPFAGLNAAGYYQDDIDEGRGDLALKVASSHIFSLESALGFYLNKDIEFAEENKLSVLLGLGWYHEFADPYRGLDARINNTLGSYKLRDTEHLNSRDRGVLSAKVNYDYKDFTIYGELMQYLEKEYPIKVDVGLKYRF